MFGNCWLTCVNKWSEIGPNRLGMLSSTPRHVWVIFRKNKGLLKNMICVGKLCLQKSTSYGSSGKPYEAKCSYFDPLFFIFPPELSQNLTFYVDLSTLAARVICYFQRQVISSILTHVCLCLLGSTFICLHSQMQYYISDIESN